MSAANKIVWSDGLFLRPHHFQQNARHLDFLVREVLRQGATHAFGFAHIQLDYGAMAHGKISLTSARGIFPDGTIFNFPENDLPPPNLEITDDLYANSVIYLCIPSAQEGIQDVESALGQDEAERPRRDDKRYRADNISVRDNTARTGDLAEIEVARLQPFLAREGDDMSSFSRLAVLKMAERTDSGEILLDKVFMPTMVTIAASPGLVQFLTELAAGLRQRAKAIASRLGTPERSSVADVSDFLLLQAFNRAVAQVEHYARLTSHHPESAYLTLQSLFGELATYLHSNRLPPELPPYDHARPERCWPPLIQNLRSLLSTSLTSSAQPIPIEKKLHGYYIAPLFDRELLSTSSFILAVKADLPQNRIARDFPAQAKIHSIEKIRELVARQMPGMPISLLPVAPRQLPFHAGYSYFLIDRRADNWDSMTNSEGFAMHIPQNFPGLELQFWALRENS